VVETVLLSADASGVRFRVRRAGLTDRGHPDTVARRLACLVPGAAGGLLHSTSWRVERDAVVLTYAALPDPYPFRAMAVAPEHDAPISADPLAPCPPGVRPVDVAAHACRHLAFLRHTDSLVADCAAALPELWRPITRFAPGMAGHLAGISG
jgi:hypothetical protein